MEWQKNMEAMDRGEWGWEQAQNGEVLLLGSAHEEGGGVGGAWHYITR